MPPHRVPTLPKEENWINVRLVHDARPVLYSDNTMLYSDNTMLLTVEQDLPQPFEWVESKGWPEPIPRISQRKFRRGTVRVPGSSLARYFRDLQGRHFEVDERNVAWEVTE